MGYFESFLFEILIGLLYSENREYAIKKIDIWLDRKQYLTVISRACFAKSDISEIYLSRVLSTSFKIKNIAALINSNHASLKHYSLNEKLYKHIFLTSINYLSQLSNSSWVMRVKYLSEGNLRKILDTISIKNIEAVFDNLLFLDTINYECHEAIKILSEYSPEQTLIYFRKRILKQSHTKIIGTYEAIPYPNRATDDSSHPLNDNLDLVISTVFEWIKDDRKRFGCHISMLLFYISPKFTPELEIELEKQIHSGDIIICSEILYLLSNYDGDIAIHNLCKTMIVVFHENEEKTSEIQNVLSSTPVLNGEYGYASALEQKITLISNWLNDSNPIIQSFASSYIESVKRHAISEKRNVDESLSLRKHLYGDNDHEKK